MKEIDKSVDSTATETQVEEVNANRRRAIVGAATGAAVAGVWHKPIVNAVVSPAHAQMSESEDEFGIEEGTTFISLDNDEELQSSSFNPLDLLIDPAYAGDGDPGGDGDVKVTYLGDGEFDYEHVNRNENVKRTGVVAVGAVQAVDVIEDCRRRSSGEPGAHNVEVLSADASGVTLRITATSGGSGSAPGNTVYFLEPGDALIETRCLDMNGSESQGDLIIDIGNDE